MIALQRAIVIRIEMNGQALEIDALNQMSSLTI